MTVQRYSAAAGVAASLLTVLIGSTPLARAQTTTTTQRERGRSWVRTEWAHPTGDKATSVLLLERFTPPEARTHTDIEYRIRITNLTQRAIKDLVLVEQFPPQFKVRATIPQVALASEGSRGTWRWETLAPRAAETIRIRGSTNSAEALDICGMVTFTFAEVFCASVPVVDPRLSLTATAPREVLICDPILLKFVVTNPGTGVLQGVRITDALPKGLTTTDGRTTLVLDVGELVAGQSRELSVEARASAPGKYSGVAEARDERGLTAKASAATIVRQPILAITKRAPDMRYVGRPATFEVTVKNIGDGPAHNTVLTQTLPPNAEVVAAARGRHSDGEITWNLGTLDPGASRSVALTIKTAIVGTVRSAATAEAYCARASAVATLEVRGIPAILLEVVDDPDPIEIGNNVIYTIGVTNQGSAVGTNIVIDCRLPPELEFVSAAGPAQSKVEGQSVRFAPLASLAPKAKATYNVVAKGSREADARFKVVMQSDQTTSPVEETESTHIY